MNTKPVAILPIFDPIKSKLCDLYESEAIFDKFTLCNSPCSNYIATGLFNGNFHIIEKAGDFNQQFELNFNKKTIMKTIPKKCTDPIPSDYDTNKKVLCLAFHPQAQTIAIASLNCLYLYSA